MNYNDHNPPHFHARYGDFEITVEIQSEIVNGTFPRRGLKLVFEWYEQHRDELLANWNSLLTTGEFSKIQPLE